MDLAAWSDPAEAPRWDLESIVPGGPGGAAFKERTAAVARVVADLRSLAERAGDLAVGADTWSAILVGLEGLGEEVAELGTFAGCASAVDARSAEARTAEGAMDDLRIELRQIAVRVSAATDRADDATFEAFLARPELASMVPALRHDRRGRALRLAPELESLRTEMDREAILAWGRLYDLVSGQLEGELDGRAVGVAELAAMRADPDPRVRSAAFRSQEVAWRSVRDVCAHTLTQITGRRLAHVDRLGVDELASSLHDNRLQRSTLDAMWAAARAARPALVRYLRHKARLLGRDRLDWWDLEAPVGSSGNERLAWGGATRWIGEAFGAFHPELATFAREALDGRWIDALPREGRRPGGFCADLPRSDQSRIFLTFTGSIDNATTLAHELGHAWHNRVLAGQPPSRTHVTSALAETASTFAEAVFRDQLLARATDGDFRRFVLDQQLSAAMAFLMDVPHRFALERKLYELRRQGTLEADPLDEATVACQREAWADALGAWNPTFWCSKLHFYIPEFGFYNWPYTFGYLFSGALHARARAEGPSFLPVIKRLLERTGWQDTEELAHEVLGVDLGSEAFWVDVVRPLDALVAEYEASGVADLSGSFLASAAAPRRAGPTSGGGLPS